MGNKKLSVEDWAKKYDDLSFKKRKVTKIDGSTVTEEVLFCQYCAYEIDIKNRPSDKINNHFKTEKHKNLKRAELVRRKNGKQLTLIETCSRSKEKEKQREGFIHDFVRAVCFDAIPIEKADGYLGKLIKKYVPSANSLPTANNLREKFLFEIFKSHVNKIKDKIKKKKISLIIDESPDFMGRPALNILTSFYDFEKREKKILLLKTAILKNTTSTYISDVLSKVLSDFDKAMKM